MPSPNDISDLICRARDGQARAVARLISLVEDQSNYLPAVAATLVPYTGKARIIGLTGPPGVGKSTTTSALVSTFRQLGKRVGVLAIDPSSPFSGGALLGDRIRMQEHALDPGVFIRSMATRGHLGGLSFATPQAVRVLDAAGCDVIVVETVGVGQSEIDVVSLADTTVLLLAPGMGDGVQAAKAGVLEVADVFVVNKADRDGADSTVRELKHMISLGRKDLPGPLWRPSVIRAVATKNQGITELITALDEHEHWMTEHNELHQRRLRRAVAEIEAIAITRLRDQVGAVRSDTTLAQLGQRILAGEIDPYRAAEELIFAVRQGK